MRRRHSMTSGRHWTRTGLRLGRPLAEAMQAQLAALAGAVGFPPWVRDNPALKPRLSGLLSTAQGVRHVNILLDTGATHCFICARLAAALGLPLSGQPGPLSVATAAAGGAQGLGNCWGCRC